jgi:RNA polymerase sigma-70 factor (ECF subfamily)
MNDRGSDERELVRRCREGSEAAYAELVLHHSRRLFSLAYRLTADSQTAEDIVQETFLTAFKSIEKVEPNPSLAPWLNTIAIRLAGRASSRPSTRMGTSLDRMANEGTGASRSGVDLSSKDALSDPHTAAEMADLRRSIDDAIATLPFKYRAAVVLRMVMGLDYAEAAQTLGVPLNTFKSNLLRGTRTLREQLADRLRMTPPLEESSGNGRSPAPDPERQEDQVVSRFGDRTATKQSVRR